MINQLQIDRLKALVIQTWIYILELKLDSLKIKKRTKMVFLTLQESQLIGLLKNLALIEDRILLTFYVEMLEDTFLT